MHVTQQSFRHMWATHSSQCILASRSQHIILQVRITGFINFVHCHPEFQKLDLFLSSGEGRETPTLLGPVERANLNHWQALEHKGLTHKAATKQLCRTIFKGAANRN
jgi:hypothetical protein